jgi:hypothetical protein
VYGSVAVRAGRAGADDRFVAGQAVDTHIQKAAEAQPEDKDRRCYDRVHP